MSRPGIRISRRYLVFELCALLSVGFLAVTELYGQDRKVVDRVVAIVDNFIIMQSELEEAARLSRLREPAPTGTETSDQDTLLKQMIEERLIRREIENFPGLEVSDKEVEKQLKSLDARYQAEGGLAAMAARWNLTLKEIEEDVRYQLRVQGFIEIRFLSFISVENEEVERHYREKLPEQLRSGGITQVPPLETVRQQIHDTLVELRLKEELNRWIEDLKQKADITLFREGLRFLPREQERTYEVETGRPPPVESGFGGEKP